MGFTRIYYLKDLADKMTLEEVKAGVLAISVIANSLNDEFVISSITETSIIVNIRSDNPVESLTFCPVELGVGYVLDVTRVKTNEQPEDAGIKKMIEALQKAVNYKLKLTPK